MIVINVEQGSDEWHFLRFRAVTGTKFKNAVGAKFSKKTGWKIGDKDIQKTLLLELVSEFQSEIEIDEYISDSMSRGNALEPISVRKASEKTGFEFESCGMLQSEIHKIFRFSPDAIYKNNENVIIGGYETKSEMGSTHINYILEDKVPDKHLLQCLCPIVMCEKVEWWCFGSYDDRNHINELFTKMIFRCDYLDMIEKCKIALDVFFDDLREMILNLGGVYND